MVDSVLLALGNRRLRVWNWRRIEVSAGDLLSSCSMQVCVFDKRRGQQEGHELDKILFFSPLDCPLPSQLSVAGLSEGLITFTR